MESKEEETYEKNILITEYVDSIELGLIEDKILYPKE